MKTMEVASKQTRPDKQADLGLSDMKMLDYKNIRGEVSEATQRPVHKTTKLNTPQGMFTEKG